MKFTIDWLKEHLETKATDTEIINKLTAIGLEVEEVVDAAALYGDFIIGEVVKEEKHPNADKLKICKVNIGNKIVDVVCGTKFSLSVCFTTLFLRSAQSAPMPIKALTGSKPA